MALDSRAGSKQDKREKNGRSRVVVQLRSKPADYIPGTGPPLQPARLLLPDDSTAYIVDRILLPSPGLAASGKPLPRRMTYIVGWHDLPAARALVPALRILEYVSSPVLEEWEWQLELELDKERARLKEETKAFTAPDGQTINKRKRGRPPAHSKIEAAATVVSEPGTPARGRRKKGAMSLSTPQKTRLDDFEGVSEDDSSPSRQVEAEMRQNIERMETDATDDLEMADVGSTSGMEGATDGNEVEEEVDEEVDIEPNKEAVPFPLTGLRPTPKRTTSFEKPFRFSSEPRSTEQLYLGTWKPTNASPNDTTSHFQLPPLRPDHPFGKQSHIPAPEPSFKWGSPVSAIFQNTPKATTVPTMARPATQASASKQTSSKKPKTPKQTPSKPSKPALKAVAEPAWEVKHLEGVEWFEVEGRGLVRYFKVRWEGDWPPDQNPSWEPEENIPAKLIAKYSKKLGKTTPKSSKKKTKQTTLPWAMDRKYSSVSEAFADYDGGDDMGNKDPGEKSDEVTNGHAELFVVEEDARR